VSHLTNTNFFPQILHFITILALLAGIISVMDAVGFTSLKVLLEQISISTINGLNLQTALIVMGIIAVVYTIIGGLKPIFTRTPFSG
jgi:SSS family solute:Na+ symporter